MTVTMQLYASQGYLEKSGTPQSLEDLKDHRLLCQRTTSQQVNAAASFVQRLLTHNIPSMLTVNNYFGVLQGVKHDLGIGVLPDYVTQDVPDLVHVLPHEKSVEVPVYLAYPEELRQSRRISAFRDFVQEEIIMYRKGKLAKQTPTL